MTGIEETVKKLPIGMYSEAEERSNRWTHGCGFVLSVLGSVYLVTSIPERTGWQRYLACLVYGSSLMAVYAMSTLSHGPFSDRWRTTFRSLDQGFIYCLIAGSVTPLAVTYLPSTVCWVLLSAMWTIAGTGFITKVCFAHRVDSVSVWIYVLQGWLPILASPWFLEQTPLPVLLWGLAGGVCYTLGTLFLIYDDRVPHFHAIWHLFVMAGSAIHFFATLHFVARAP